ncbi:MAG: murein hydrolase activator EnvC family protein, partial [Longimicrobiales bacterium]
MRSGAGLVLVAMMLIGAPAHAQERDLRTSQTKLDSIRQEQMRLRTELESLQTRVRDASQELTNITRQRETTASALLELDFQTSLLDENAARITQELGGTRAQMRRRTERLGNRLRAIYKRGPMHSVRVLLTAQSFADLLNRYRYLHILARRDRAMIAEVAELEQSLIAQDRTLQETMRQLERLREDKALQVAELERLEQQRERALGQYRSAQTRTEGRLERLAQDARELTSVIERLERERVAAERRAATGSEPAAAPSASISTRDLGTLNWPVEG